MAVRLILSVVVGLALSLSPAAYAMKQLELKSHSHIAAIDIPLSGKEKAWLAAQPTLTVGTWLPERTPIVYDGDEKSYQGINADYLALMAHSLGLKVIIRQYDTEQQALTALADRQVDTLLTQVAHRDALAPGLDQSAPLLKTWPTLVTSLKSPLPPLTTDRRVTLACTRDCAFFDIIQQAFPNAKITLYDSDYQALASVVSGENQYFIGNNITTGHCISKYFSQSLVIAHYFRQQEQHNRFVTREDRPALHQLLDRFIHAIDSDTAMRIMQNWLNRGDLSFLNTPLPFTAEEQRWLRKHRHIRLLVNPYFPPFTLVDDEDELRGIMADMLNIFSLQTGLQFDPILMALEKEANAAENEAKRMEREASGLMAAIKRSKDEIEQGSRSFLQLQAQVATLDDSISSERMDVDRLTDQLHTMEEERAKRLNSIDELRERRDNISAELNDIKERSHRAELNLNKAQLELQNMQDRIWSDYELTYENAQPMRRQIAITASHIRVDELKTAIRALGDVNVGSIEDYKNVKERYDELNAQYDDLTRAEADLQVLITDLVSTMEEEFRRQFALIQQNFSQVFVELFGGGRAELILSDKDDILNCDIDIIAQPPGKKLQLLSLLSGGERALTAIALLFAILKLKPTAFCILDEIESALDDANVTNFAEYVRNYSDDTQFILITHRKGSMAVCDSLYGVAMEERGVSKVVSAKFTESA